MGGKGGEGKGMGGQYFVAPQFQFSRKMPGALINFRVESRQPAKKSESADCPLTASNGFRELNFVTS